MPGAPWPVSDRQNCIGHQSPALDIRAQLMTTKLVMEAGRGDRQGRESGDIRLMDQGAGVGGQAWGRGPLMSGLDGQVDSHSIS